MTNTVTLSPVRMYKEFWAYGAVDKVGLANASFVIAPSNDVADTLGTANNRWGTVYCNNIVIGNSSIGTNSSGNGYCSMPGGLIFQWGSFPSAPSTGNSMSLPLTFPTAVLSCVASGQTANHASVSANTTKVTAISTAGNPVISWFCIGN